MRQQVTFILQTSSHGAACAARGAVGAVCAYCHPWDPLSVLAESPQRCDCRVCGGAGAVIYTAISVSPWRPKSAGVFSSGCIFIYCTYLCWGALSSQPAGDCVPKSASSLPIQVGLHPAAY